MLDLRVYRAAFLPALVAVFVAAFSLADRPAPVTTDLSADTFDTSSAFGDEARPQRNSLNELARSFPDRRPGAPDDAALADRIAATFGLEDRRTRRTAFQVTRTSTEYDDVDLETVVGVRPGLSSRRIVVLANRDARGGAGGPGLAELSATATLLELARLFRQRDLRKTLVLVSTSGATTGFAGARAWARETAGAVDGGGRAGSLVDAVLVLGDVAGREIRKPWVVPWATDASPAPLRLLRTVESALREEVEPNPGGARASGQWIRRAAPLTVSGQGVVNAAGLPAVMISASGEVGPEPDAAVARGRLGQFGRAVLRTVTAIDAAGPADADEAAALDEGAAGIVTMRNVLPDWAVRMLIGTLLLPALLAALDAWFRARRRRLPAGRWARWVAAGALPFALAWLWLRLLGLTGALDVPAAPVVPDAYEAGAAGIIAAASALVVAAVGWFGLRPLLLRRVGVSGSPAAGGLSAATGMIVTVLAAVVWVANPYAAALLLPAAHLWLFAGSPTSRHGRAPALLMVIGGVLLPLLVLVHYGRALELDPLALAWLATLVTAGGHVSAGAAIAVSLWLACLAGVVTVVRTRRRVEAKAEPEPLRTRGPAGYAGPGSLGGTESALRR
jgi:hypothetical protein